MKKYKMIILMGEAGSGKDRILNEILSRNPDKINPLVSYTTRPKREGEIEGVNYHYISEADFLNKVRQDLMLETSYFNTWWYGLGKDVLTQNKINIGVFNPEGVRSLMSQDDIEIKVFRISCKDKTRLLRQLNRENDPNVQEILRRFNADFKDFAILDFEYVKLVNETPEDLEACIQAVMAEID